MDYALVLRALERHVGISQRALDFFRERRLGRQHQEGMIVLDEAQRAFDEVKKMRDFHQLQKEMHKVGMAPPPNPVPPDTPNDYSHSGVDFPDAKLSSGNKQN